MLELIKPKQNELVLLNADTDTLEIKNSVLYLNCLKIEFHFGIQSFKLKFLTAKIKPISPDIKNPRELNNGTII